MVYGTLECGSSSRFTVTNLVIDIALDLLGFPTIARNSIWLCILLPLAFALLKVEESVNSWLPVEFASVLFNLLESNHVPFELFGTSIIVPLGKVINVCYN
jgi:hypothetical protein